MPKTKFTKKPTAAQRRKTSLAAKLAALDLLAQSEMQRKIHLLEQEVAELRKLVLERVPNVNLPTGEYRPSRLVRPMCVPGGTRYC